MNKDTIKVCDFNHVILYAKGWYKETNVIDDLRQIFCERSLIDAKYMSNSDIWNLMVTVAFKYIEPRFLEHVFCEMFHDRLFRWSDTCNYEKVIKAILGKLSIITVRNDDKTLILNLGTPDEKILPFANENILERWKECNPVEE